MVGLFIFEKWLILLALNFPHTYFRQQHFSIVSVPCSLVHQPNTDYSSNLQDRQRENVIVIAGFMCENVL